ncbi:hypothetical protein CEP54_011970 [Fusarium duplospermum]|uniref:Uncharacterized protein n=1 Tax=Fusarium duplospermum TaxID=1325734 RepID=A0A428PBD4_9HYPO|nr:hypothetical protein CEP54_011970 [Fusarium duplospermum]
MELPLNNFAEILDVSVVSENNDPFGKIKSGWIRLRCHMSQAVLSLKHGSVELHVLVDRKWLSPVRLFTFLDFQNPDIHQTAIRGTIPLPDNDQVQFQGHRVFLALLCRYKCHYPGAAKREYTGVFRDNWDDLNKEPHPDEPTGDYAGLILYPTGKEGQIHPASSSKEDEEIAPEKRGKIRGIGVYGVDTKERYEFDSDDDELFYGMSTKEAPIARGLLGS